MPNMMENITRLASEIGPRPAGTEEEQNAALYIEETLKGTTALPTQVEEFEGANGNDMTRLICAGVAVVAGFMFMLTAALAIPGLLLGLAAVVLFGADFFGKPLIARFFSKGVSQNVVAKYTPASQPTRGRKRKIIVVTRYDSGKVRREMKQPFVRFLGLANRLSAGAIVFIFVWMLFRAIFFMYPEGIVAVVLNIIMVIALIFAALPLILRILEQTASYNDGANSSAAGVAVMVEVARRVADSEFAPVEAAEDEVVVHDAEAAEVEGVVPDGAEVVYETAPTAEVVEEQVEEPVVEEEPEPEVVEPEPEPEPEPELKPAPVSDPAAVAAVAAASTIAVGQVLAQADNTPDWFKNAQAKARKSTSSAPVSSYRSRYAAAYDAMEAEKAAAAAAEAEAAAQAEAESRARALAEAEAAAAAALAAQQQAAQPEPVQAEEPVVEQEIVEEVANEVAEEVVEEAPAFVHDGSVADQLPGMLAEGKDAIPEVSDLEMPSFLFTAQAGGQAVEQQENQAEEPAYVENVADFVGQPQADEAPVAGATGRMPVVLPDIEDALAPIESMQQQRAPLADGAVAEDNSVAAKGLLNMLPSIDIAAPAASEGGRPALNLPSLSGAFAPVAAAGSAGMTGSFAPVGDQLAAAAEDPEDMFIDDADDSDFEENFTETGAYAGPDYVEMPKSRFGNLFGGLFKKKNAPAPRPMSLEQSSTSEWLDVDDDFDARSVGAARGDWSSFQEDSEWEGGQTVAFTPVDGDGYDEYEDDFEEDRPWEGGAFSAMKDKVSGAASGAAGALGSVKDRLPFGAKEEEPAPARGRSRRVREEEEPMREERVRAPRQDPFGGLGVALTEAAAANGEPEPYQFNEDEKIEQFQNPGIKTEVWFVALGSDLDGNAGMRAFIDTHASELRGAMILEIDGPGAGVLSLVGDEGSLKKISASSRMKRYLRKASQVLGASLPTVSLPWSDSAASVASAHGCQAIHLIGMDGDAPAMFGQADDVAELIDPESLAFAADYVMEVIRAV